MSNPRNSTRARVHKFQDLAHCRSLTISRSIWTSTVCLCFFLLPSWAVVPSTYGDYGSSIPMQQEWLNVTDPNAMLDKHTTRTYMVSNVHAHNKGSPLPLLIYFHGQGGDFRTEAVKFANLGIELGYHTVSPKGLQETTGTTAWSIDTQGRTDVCTAKCVPTIYPSCSKVNQVSNCNWATCYSDVHFIQVLLEHLFATLNVDRTRVFAVGCSNGAMFIDHLVATLPNTFAGVAPWYGGFLKHAFPPNPSAFRNTSLVSFHGLKDVTIPPNGGVSDGDWLYVSENTTINSWAKSNGCASTSLGISTPFDNAKPKHSCVQHHRCDRARVIVVYCTFPHEHHGFWPDYAENMTMWFLLSQSHTLV
eukprot:m.137752 g.137752  ORF g.137752 m.137752 type:complete len:362 (+) comp29943_c0_seq1:611-1696(+)